MKSPLYPIFFIVLITVLFIGSLSALYVSTSDRIAMNQRKAFMQSVLYACDVFPPGMKEEQLSSAAITADIPWKDSDLINTFSTTITRISVPISDAARSWISRSSGVFGDSLQIAASGSGKSRIYGFSLTGMGLWGSISAYAVVNWDISRMVGLDIINQVETPGLGARITEQEFKSFFRNLNLEAFFAEQESPSPIKLVAKKAESNIENSVNTIQAITGATQTSNGVVNMMNTDLRVYLLSLAAWMQDGKS